ncbi:DUF2213 domain-containing protein [Azospirillum argentinense]
MPPVAPRPYLGDLIRLLIRFFMEEAQEPEHQGPDAGARDAPPQKTAAGVIFRAPDGSVLLLKRSPDDANFAGHWSLPGGGADPGETAEQAAVRECLEEIGREPPGPLRLLSRQETPTGMAFHTFECPVEEKFEPTLNGEHTDHVWVLPGALPDPMHPKVRQTLTGLGAADSAPADRLAMDRGDTVRTKDADGRLRVERANISKAVVNPYLGREIPGWEALGLLPDRAYRLLRHPDELARAASSFNALPLLDTHVPATAWDHPKGKVVGTTGTDAAFEAPYLTNSLAVWTADAIAGIEDGTRKELSCGYRYDPDMTSGTWEGQPYDGVMRNIQGNHVALVREGRAGPDVAVDAKNPEIETMSKYKGIVAKLRGALKGKMAQDAMGEVDNLLGELEAGDEAEVAPAPAKRMTKAEILAALTGKLGDEDMAALGNMLGEDEEPATDPNAGVPVTKAKNEPAPFPGKPIPGGGQEPITKAAMDAALKAEAAKTEAAVIARMQGVTEALDVVRPVVGKLAVACDSADGVFKAALEMQGVNVKDVHPSAYRAMWDMHAASLTPRRAAPAHAMDAASAKGFADRYPGAGRIGTV